MGCAHSTRDLLQSESSDSEQKFHGQNKNSFFEVLDLICSFTSVVVVVVRPIRTINDQCVKALVKKCTVGVVQVVQGLTVDCAAFCLALNCPIACDAIITIGIKTAVKCNARSLL